MRYIWLLVILLLSSCAASNRDSTSDDSTLVLRVPYVFIPSTSQDWNNIENQIRTTRAKTVVLLWEGRGGEFLIGNPFKDTVYEAESRGKSVIMEVTGPALSLHAYALCWASKVIYTGHAVIMFHDAADVMTGKVIAGVSGNAELKSMVDICLDKGILTLQDVANLESVREVWIDSHGHRTILYDRRLTS